MLTTKSFTLGPQHIATIEQVAKDHGDTTVSAAMRYIIDEYVRLTHAAQTPRPEARVATTERRCHDCGVALDEFDGGRFCIECLRANYEVYEDEAPRPEAQAQERQEGSDD
jgi:hypothetical protein